MDGGGTLNPDATMQKLLSVIFVALGLLICPVITQTSWSIGVIGAYAEALVDINSASTPE